MNSQTSAGTPGRRAVSGEVVRSILFGGIAPFLIYTVLRPHVSEFSALLIAALAPLLRNAVMLVRKRTLDIFGVFALASIALSVVLVLLGGSPKLLLIRESLVTSAFGLAFLVSLFLRRPLIFYLARHFSMSSEPGQREEWSARWQYPYFRFVMYLMTAVWGSATLLEGLARSYLVFKLPTQSFLAVSPFVQYGVLGVTIAWTLWYGRRARGHGEWLQKQTEPAHRPPPVTTP